MSAAALKSIWPFFAAPKVRTWVEGHVGGGTIERLMIATNAPMSTLKASGPPVPDDGLAVEIVGHGAELRPVQGLPAIRDADFNVRVSGRTATINVGRGNVEISQGRKLSITNGVFEVPDTFPKAPPAKARFRLDGSVPAAAELLASERLREHAGMPLDPATSRGTLTAQVTLGMPIKADLAPGSTLYTVVMDVTNFAAERVVMGHKVEAAALKVNANNQGFWIRGDVKINSIPANLDYRKPHDMGDAEIRLQATLDEAARGKLGFDLSGMLSGPVPIKVNGRIPANESEARLGVEADLTPSKVDNLLPGWSKAAGKSARATFTMITKSPGTRFEDMVVEAPGTSVKGALEVDGNGNIVTASFPVFSLSDGDKTTLKADRSPDGTLRVTLRGDVYDGRGLVKSGLTGPANAKQQKQEPKDIDLDVKIGTVAGYHGETLRGLDLKLSRRGGSITNFAINAKIGRGSPLTGDLRGRAGSTRQVIYVESGDAGAFFRFSDIYAKIIGGEMWVAMDPQSADQAPQDGILNIRDFVVRGEAGLDRVAGAASRPAAVGRRVLAAARRLHPLARTLRDQGRAGARPGDRRDRRRLYRLHAERPAHARHLRAALWLEQHVRADSDLRAVPGRQQRGPARRDLRGGRPAVGAGAARQPDLGSGAGPLAQVLRIPDHQHARAAELRRSQPRPVIFSPSCRPGRAHGSRRCALSPCGRGLKVVRRTIAGEGSECAEASDPSPNRICGHVSVALARKGRGRNDCDRAGVRPASAARGACGRAKA